MQEKIAAIAKPTFPFWFFVFVHLLSALMARLTFQECRSGHTRVCDDKHGNYELYPAIEAEPKEQPIVWCSPPDGNQKDM